MALKFQTTVYRRGKGTVSDKEKLIREQCMNDVRRLKMENWAKIPVDQYDSVLNGWIQHRQLILNHDVKG